MTPGTNADSSECLLTQLADGEALTGLATAWAAARWAIAHAACGRHGRQPRPVTRRVGGEDFCCGCFPCSRTFGRMCQVPAEVFCLHRRGPSGGAFRRWGTACRAGTGTGSLGLTGGPEALGPPPDHPGQRARGGTSTPTRSAVRGGPGEEDVRSHAAGAGLVGDLRYLGAHGEEPFGKRLRGHRFPEGDV